MKEMKEPPAHPVLHWIYKTESAGRDGCIVVSQTAFNAIKEAEITLKTDRSKLTVVQGSKFVVPLLLTVPLPEGFELLYQKKKLTRKKKTNERKKSNGKRVNGASHSKRSHANGARARHP
jgi:hypothetical protein